MATYQNTSEFYCDNPAMDIYPAHCTDQNVFFNQNPTLYQIHENYENQEFCSSFTQANNTATNFLYEGHFNDNAAIPQYSIQYTPPTPEPVSYPVFNLDPTPYQNINFMAKRHRAQITILPSSKGNFKAVVKRKRKRTVFTTEQVEALEDIFKTKQYISREERQEIVNQLQLNDKAVKIWFQNRRLKVKRMNLEETEEYSNIDQIVEERSSPDIARLNSVESQISDKTDEFGFVTLDDGVMGDLVTVIDEFLTKSNPEVRENVRSDSSAVYEPISPASLSDSYEENSSSSWKPSEPQESLQRLFDLQTMLAL